MRIISKKRLREFYISHADAESSILEWARKVESAIWKQFADVRMTFGSADQVTIRVRQSNLKLPARLSKTVVVFNVGGNKYRLIASINYATRIIYILRLMTHSEYSADKWKEHI